MTVDQALEELRRALGGCNQDDIEAFRTAMANRIVRCTSDGYAEEAAVYPALASLVRALIEEGRK